MLFFHQQNLVFLEVPKTGSSAVRKALLPFASISITHPTHIRHMNVEAFEHRTLPYLKKISGQTPQTFAVMRDPVDRMVSWYRYLISRPQSPGGKQIIGLGFDAYVRAILAEDPKIRNTGTQSRFILGERAKHMVDTLFQYDRQDLLLEFLRTKFGSNVRFKKHNVSKAAPIIVSQETRGMIEAGRGQEMQLWNRLREHGTLTREC